MKKFEVPEVTVIYFEKRDVITTSTCPCVECSVCPDGSNHCPEVDDL